MSNTEERVKEVVAKIFRVETGSLSSDTHLADDLGADSLDMMEVIMAIEEEFSFEIMTKELDNVGTIKEIVQYLSSRV
jgi:acyl carrier protein